MTSGADRLCAALVSRGVDCAFGVPGTQTIPLYEALRRSPIRSVLATNELAAGFMANGYFRASGRIAPLLTIPGPGFTWALTAVAEALHDSVGLLHVVARSASPDGRQHLQAIDQPRVAGPLVKGCLRIDDVEQVEDVVRRAFSLATSDEPGPVLVEWLPEALLADAPEPARHGHVDHAEPGGEAPAEVYSLMDAAARPVIFAGQGCMAVAEELREVAELLGAPVLTTASARGLIPEDHRLCMCFDIERGQVGPTNALLGRADRILVIAAKLGASGSGGFSLKLPEERLIRVDVSAESLRSTYPGRHAVRTSAEQFVPGLLAWLEAHPRRRQSQWTPGELEDARRNLRRPSPALPEPEVGGAGQRGAEFFGMLRQALPRDAIVVADSGLHQQLLRRHFDVLAPRGLLFPSDFQSMGFALGAAIGARLAAPDRKVVAVLGDGGFAMSGMELLTAVREKLSLTVIVLNDGQLGRIRYEQLSAYGRSSSVKLLNPDFRAVATGLGATYSYCETDARGVLARAVDRAGVHVVEVPVKDTGDIHALRVRGLLRQSARRVLPRAFVSSLKRVLS